ncbi:MAG: hypothetical protein B7Z63_02780 [Ignavibacteriae bacterium 37-53-5]|nr:MAG: hypothetical protein B7Z63_02780 [Ignavibacteriae bacterium 37-53-5]
MVKNQNKSGAANAIEAHASVWRNCLAILSVLLVSSATSVDAQGKWYANGFIQYSFGDYTFGTNTNTLYFIPGILYESDYWDVSAALSVVSQNNNLVTRAGGMLLPHGGSGMSSAGMGGMGGSGGTSMMSGGMTSVGHSIHQHRRAIEDPDCQHRR